MTAIPSPGVPMHPNLKAAIWMSGAIVSFSAMAVAGKAVSTDLDTFEIMLYRSLIGFVIVLTAASLTGRRGEINARHMGWHTLRNISHFTGQNLWFYAVTAIPLAQVFALEFTAPLWVLLLSPLVLGERLTTGAAGFVGILIVARPSPETINAGVIAAALAAIAFAGSAVFTRRLMRSVSATCVLFWLTTMQAVLGLVCAGFDGDIAVPAAASWPWVALIAVAGLVAHFCLTTALGLAPAAVVMPIDFTRLPVIAVVGALIYGEALDPMVFLGGFVIFAANYLNLRHETKRVT